MPSAALVRLSCPLKKTTMHQFKQAPHFPHLARLVEKATAQKFPCPPHPFEPGPRAEYGPGGVPQPHRMPGGTSWACWILDWCQESLEQHWLRKHLAPTWRRKTQFWQLGHQPSKDGGELSPPAHLPESPGRSSCAYSRPSLATSALPGQPQPATSCLYASSGEDVWGTAIYPSPMTMQG